MITKTIQKIKNNFHKLKNNPTIISVLFITGLYMASRVLGFARSIFLYQYDKINADLFLFGIDRISGTITAIFFMGALASSVLPVAGQILETKGEKDFNRFISIILVILVIFMVLVMGVGVIFTPQLLEYLNPKLWQSAIENLLLDDYILISRLSFLVSINFGLQALFGVVLNLKNKFLIFSLAGVITNISCILGILYHKNDIVAITVGLVLGCSLSTILYIGSAIYSGFEFPKNVWLGFGEYKTELLSILKSFIPRMFIIDGLTVSGLALGFLFQTTGQAIAFDLATSIQGAFFVVITALGIVFFPDLNKVLNDKNLPKNLFWDKLVLYLRNVIWLGLFISIICVVLSPVIMWLFELFGKGQNQGQYIILLIQIGSFRLFFQGIKEILDKYLYTKQKKLAPMFLSLCSMVGQLVFLFVISQILYKGIDAGVAVVLSLVFYYMVWCILALFLIRNEYKKEYGKLS